MDDHGPVMQHFMDIKLNIYKRDSDLGADINPEDDLNYEQNKKMKQSQTREPPKGWLGGVERLVDKVVDKIFKEHELPKPQPISIVPTLVSKLTKVQAEYEAQRAKNTSDKPTSEPTNEAAAPSSTTEEALTFASTSEGASTSSDISAPGSPVAANPSVATTATTEATTNKNAPSAPTASATPDPKAVPTPFGMASIIPPDPKSPSSDPPEVLTARPDIPTLIWAYVARQGTINKELYPMNPKEERAMGKVIREQLKPKLKVPGYKGIDFRFYKLILPKLKPIEDSQMYQFNHIISRSVPYYYRSWLGFFRQGLNYLTSPFQYLQNLGKGSNLLDPEPPKPNSLPVRTDISIGDTFNARHIRMPFDLTHFVNETVEKLETKYFEKAKYQKEFSIFRPFKRYLKQREATTIRQNVLADTTDEVTRAQMLEASRQFAADHDLAMFKEDFPDPVLRARDRKLPKIPLPPVTLPKIVYPTNRPKEHFLGKIVRTPDTIMAIATLFRLKVLNTDRSHVNKVQLGSLTTQWTPM